MAENFSSRIVYAIATESYPATTLRAAQDYSAKSRILRFFLGDKALKEVVAKFGPDVIYTDSALYGAHFKILSFATRHGAPMIVHLRGDWWREYWAWFSVASWRRRLLGTQQYTYNWTSLVSAKKVTPICRWLERVVTHYLPCKETEVVYQGVDPRQFFPRNESRKPEHPSVAIIQNHTIYPKVAGLLQFRQVVEKLPKVHFYITEGESDDQRYLELVKKTYRGADNVHFVKGVDSPAAVADMLAAADCYVLASGLDCCPTTVLEASLMGKPVIASRVGGIPEIVLQNETGWAIRNSSTEEWVGKINLVLSNPKLSRAIGKRGRQWVAERFSWKTIATQVERMLIDCQGSNKK